MYLFVRQFFIVLLILCVSSVIALGACPQGDLSGNCQVGIEDLVLFAVDWLSTSSSALGDLDGLYSEGIYVNMADFSVLAENWLKVGSLLHITEFMASNDSTLGTRVDNVDVYPDWIEIHNPTTGAVDLTGWSLTDSDGDLDKWQFPNGEELDPGEYLVVFASGNAQPENTGQYPYVDSDGKYHTNFSLDADGGSKYLAIVMPDGVTISHEYDGYPDQYTDISYGLVNEVLVNYETAMSYHVPADESIWMTEDYVPDPDFWSSGIGGVGFGVTVVTGSEMIIFDEVSDLDLLGTVEYAINCGTNQNFMVGTVDFRGDVYQWQPSDINGDDATNWHDNLYNAYCPGKSDPSPSITGVTVECSDFDTDEVPGQAPMDHGPYEGRHDNNNTDGLFSGDGSQDAINLREILRISGTQNIGYYNGTEGERDMIFGFAVTPGKVYKVQVLLYKNLVNNEATGMRIAFEQPDNVVYDKLNLDTACSSSEGLIHSTTLVAGDNTLTVHIGRQTDNGNISIGDIAGIVVTDLGEGVTDVESVMRDNNSSIWTRSEFTLDVENAELDYTSLTLQMQYEDGFVAYLNGTEVARSNTPGTVNWDSSAASDRAISLGYEDFDITEHLNLLHSGTNVLAIQGLNDEVGDGEFLILPKLIAGGGETGQFFLLDASPGQTNGDPKYYVGDTTFNFNRGFYDSAFGLEITSASPGVEIRYTTDGSTPSELYGDVYYSTPINIGGTTCVRAMAHMDGWVSTNVDTQTFIFLDDVLRQGTDSNGFPVDPDGYPEFWGPAAHKDYPYTPDDDYPLHDVPYPYNIGDPVLADYAMDPDVVNGPSHTDNYENAFGVRDALLSLPTLSLVTDKAELFDPSGIYLNTLTDGLECPVSMELFYPDGSQDCQEDAGLRIYGGEGRSPEFRKHSMRIAFRSQYGASKLRFDVFDGKATDEFDTLILRAGSNWSWHGWEGQWGNTQFVTDEIARRFQLAMGQPSAYGTFVHVYLNGMYWGMYNLVERPVADFAATYLGGEEEDYDALNKGEVKDGDAVAWDAAQAIAEAVIAGSKTVEQGYQELSQYVDFGNLIDFLMVQYYGGNGDWDYKNWYATRLRQPGAGYMFYAWDSEDFLQCNVDQNDRTIVDEEGCPTRLYTALRGHPEFQLLFADHAQKHLRNGGVMSPEGATAQFRELVDLVDRATVAESARWGDAREYRPDAGTFTREDHFIPKRDFIFNSFLLGRSEVLIGFLRGADLYPSFDPPAFNVNGSPQHGGYLFSGDIVSLEGTEEIYYTIDGRDPRDNEFPDEGDVRRVFIPTSDIGDTWKSDLNFDDSSWISGTGGIGYEATVGYDSYINIDVETQMHGVNPGCYVRIPFSLSAEFLSSIETLKIMVRYDDGFVAYVNGTEIAHANAPGRDGNTDPLIWSSPATSNHSDTEAVQWQIIDVSNSIGDLVAGDNLLAIHAMDVSLTSSDFLISVKFDVEIEEDPSEINMTKSTHVRARSYDSSASEWSALTEATYSIGPIVENLRITEMMYHPADPNAAEIALVNDPMLGDDDFEYVELQNTGAETINLNMVSFIDGIYYTFGDVDLAADEYIVVVENRDAFEARYGTGLNMADGVYTGSLSNSGEKIRLRDAVDTKVLTFDYSDGWYDMTDGDGFSLTIRDAYAADPNLWDEKVGWRPSAAANGSPGTDDTGIVPAIGSVVINEVLAHSDVYPNDWIELYNTTGDLINIGNWYLSDSGSDLTKYKIPEGTSIGGYGYIVFTQDDDFGAAFALSENGETVYLTSGDGTQITGYSEEEDFDASLSGVAFGRHEKSTGTFNFVAMSVNTPGASYEGAVNALPKVGPIVINEIMYHPTDAGGDAEYIELLNISGSSVTLYDYTTSEPWKITDGVEYTFPLGTPTTIAAGDYFLLIRDLAAFTAEYGAPTAGKYAVWDDGSLSNGGEKVEISQPGDEVGGVRQYIRVDRISYSDGSAEDDDWPTAADGLGMALSRKVDSDYGNDVANWEAVTASPGIVNP